LLSCGFGEGGLWFGLGVAFEVAGVLGVSVVTELNLPGMAGSAAAGPGIGHLAPGPGTWAPQGHA
jgi:hypothetical protein